MISHRPAFLKYIAQTSSDPHALEIVKANGPYLIDRNGKRYLDLISGIGVNNTGHRSKRVVQAIRKQLGKYLHTMVFGEHIQFPQVRLASLLNTVLPDTLNSTYFVNSGSEAIEGALKLAKRGTGRHKVVAMRHAYHGSTHGALSLMSSSYFSDFYRPLLPEVYFADLNVMQSLDLIDKQTACVVVEPIQGEAGYIPSTMEFLSAIRERCSEKGAILIFDEIQSGMGRTGSLFAFEQYGVVPDILCLAKAFGGGLPLGAFIADRDLMQVLSHDPVLGHITTFGGHPLSCAAAYENLKWMVSDKLYERAGMIEDIFRTELAGAPFVEKITGKGAMLALHLDNKDRMQFVVSHCMGHGVMTDWFLYNEQAVRIAPPLTISKEQCKKACRILIGALERSGSEIDA
ncbi:MAG: aspartate aminotransferase family protein [Flavobacteriales bacterium]|nr:aspartate aminotransferase family protein [Flavobacteriales bacterium]